MSYSAFQIEDALKAQGVDSELAQQIAWSLGDQRLDANQTKDLYSRLGAQGARLPEGQEGKQGGSFLTNLGEGVGGTLGALALKRAPILGAMMGGTLGSVGGEKLSGTNFYERATTPQVLADMGGSMLGGMAGSALGGGVGRALAGRAAGAVAGRVAGGTLGSVLGPAGSIAGAALGGWLLPKLLPDGSKSVVEDDGESGGGWGILGTAAAVPLAYKAARHFAPDYVNPLARKAREGIKAVGGEPLQEAYNKYKKANPPLGNDAKWWEKTKYKAATPFREMSALGEGGEELTYQLARRLARMGK